MKRRGGAEAVSATTAARSFWCRTRRCRAIACSPCWTPARCDRAAFDHIVSSGELALAHLEEKGYERVYYIGPRDRDAAFFERSLASVRRRWRKPRRWSAPASTTTGPRRRKPMRPSSKPGSRGGCRSCAPIPIWSWMWAAGTIYAPGRWRTPTSTWAARSIGRGKPYPAAYEGARGRGSEHPRRGRAEGPDPRHRRCAAHGPRRARQRPASMPCSSPGGIHRDDTMEDGAISEKKLAKLFAGSAPSAIAAMPVLSW